MEWVLSLTKEWAESNGGPLSLMIITSQHEQTSTWCPTVPLGRYPEIFWSLACDCMCLPARPRNKSPPLTVTSQKGCPLPSPLAWRVTFSLPLTRAPCAERWVLWPQLGASMSCGSTGHELGGRWVTHETSPSLILTGRAALPHFLGTCVGADNI